MTGQNPSSCEAYLAYLLANETTSACIHIKACLVDQPSSEKTLQLEEHARETCRRRVLLWSEDTGREEKGGGGLSELIYITPDGHVVSLVQLLLLRRSAVSDYKQL